MIFGIGTDIVRVARIQHNLERYGTRFVNRVLTPHERRGYTRSLHPARFVAKRFAAKEAAAKALGTGLRHGIGLLQIEVRRDPGGPPRLHFHGAARDFVQERGIRAAHLSLSDEDDHALAVVVLECETTSSPPPA